MPNLSPGAPRGALSYGALFASPGLITVPPLTGPGVTPTLWDWQEPMLHLVLVAALSDYSYGDSRSYESTGSYDSTGNYGSGNYGNYGSPYAPSPPSPGVHGIHDGICNPNGTLSGIPRCSDSGGSQYDEPEGSQYAYVFCCESHPHAYTAHTVVPCLYLCVPRHGTTVEAGYYCVRTAACFSVPRHLLPPRSRASGNSG